MYTRKRAIQALTLWQSFEAYSTRRRLVIQVHLIPVSYTHLDVYKRQLMQCSDFFDEHKDINQVAVRNTAFSAKKVKDDGDITPVSYTHLDVYKRQSGT